VTVGIYSLTGFQVTPDTVVAVLTVLGYSLYDTVVVFDRIRENAKGLGASGRITYSDMVNLSMNQTLARSINTSLVAIIPVLSVLVVGSFILGATSLQDFGLALVIGLTSGAYSSIFIASPLLAIHEGARAALRHHPPTARDPGAEGGGADAGAGRRHGGFREQRTVVGPGPSPDRGRHSARSCIRGPACRLGFVQRGRIGIFSCRLGGFDGIGLIGGCQVVVGVHPPGRQPAPAPTPQGQGQGQGRQAQTALISAARVASLNGPAFWHTIRMPNGKQI
jgi:hypothetical protein